jgi:hypothetical protein
MRSFEEKPFRSEEEESAKEAAEIHIRIGHPRVRPHVAPFPGKTGSLTKTGYVTSFLAAWEPVPTPPAHWIELLRQAPFGSQTIRARDLHWDGRSFSVERLSEAEIEAFAVEMTDWVDFANAMFRQREHTPAEEALASARERAQRLEDKLRR